MALENRYDFVLLFDVQDGNPNGDPDAGNLPRLDAETGHGLVTDVCLKRKVRNFIQATQDAGAGRDIFIKEKAVLNATIERVYKDLGLPTEKKSGEESVDKARTEMCRRFYDIRTFGAVMSTGLNAGQVRGPVQLTFARSIDPVITSEHAITRMAVATEKEAEKQGGDNRTMGRKFTIPYGLYLAHGFVSPHLAKQTGFDAADLELLWQSFEHMLEFDRSAARGLMSLQKLVIFRHKSDLGSAPAHRLFERIQVSRRDADRPARAFSDYDFAVNTDGLPDGVTVQVRPE
jgi:CRISPR-associated protein Csd2